MNSKKIMIASVVILLALAASTGVITNLFFVDDFHYLEPAQFDNQTTDLSEEAITENKENPVMQAPRGDTNYGDSTMPISDEFTTELPLVVIDLGSNTLEVSYEWSEEKGYMILKEGKNPYASAAISVIDNPNSVNTLLDEPALMSDVIISYRGNSSLYYDKHQYRIVTVDENNQNLDLQMLDIGTGHEWGLNGTFSDSTQIRNYLAFSLAGQFLESTPDVRFTEVVLKTDNGYEYLGIHLLTEQIDRSNDRVDIPAYSANSSTHATFIMRRDRDSGTAVILDNYGTVNGFTESFVEVLYPNNVSQNDIDILTSKIDSFEKVLFSDDPEVFKTYKDFIDVESFYDYFIMNELLLNYDAGFNSTYFHSDYTGKIIMGPIWDFDESAGNVGHLPLKLDATAFHATPWFDTLLKDVEFTTGLIERYKELRQNELSDEKIENIIDTAVAHLGTAVEREWDRWGYYYYGDYFSYENSVVSTTTTTYEEQIEEMKTTIFTHGKWLDEEIDSLYQFAVDEFSSESIVETELNWGTILGTVFVLIWISVVVILQRRI